MNWSASVVSTVSSDTEPIITINFESRKYVFNAGESAGRSFLQSRATWRKTEGLFLTSLGTQRGSGVPGLLMFLADASIAKMNIVGPPGTLHFLAQMRPYLYRPSLYVNPIEAESPGKHYGLQPEPIFQDENLRVYGIPLVPGTPDAALAASETGSKRKRSPSPDASSKRGKPSDDITTGSTEEPPLIERAQSADFNPSILTGSEAQEWRTLVIKNMFGCKEPEPKSRKKGKEESKSEDAVQPRPSFGLMGSRKPRREDLVAADDERRPSFGLSKLLRGSQLPKLDVPKTTLCYVCVGPEQRGKFDGNKADALKVPRGPIRAKVIKGETISFMVDDGNGSRVERVVRPEELMGSPEPPKVVMIFDVPSADHIPSLVSAFETSPFYKNFLGVEHANERTVYSIFHICGEGVLEDDRYKALMNRFAPSVHHIVASREHAADPVTFTNAAYSSMRLNKLDPEMFRTQKFRLEPAKQLSDVLGLPKNTMLMYANLYLDVRPASPPRHSKHAEGRDLFHPVVHSAEPLDIPAATLDAFQTAKERAAELLKSRDNRPGDDVVIVPLGTGSAIPTKYRNVSSTLVQIPKYGNILLDAGEGTWGQLTRLFGDDPVRSSGVWQVLRDLKCLFLSHCHGDHHIGAAKILAMRQKMNPKPTEPLYVVGLRPHLMYLREYCEFEDLGIDRPDGTGVETILSDTAHWQGLNPGYGYQTVMPYEDEALNTMNKSAMCDALGLSDFVVVDVMHKVRCYGCVIKHSDRWSISFSADTMPTHNLVQAGMYSTLLIHEATMADDQAEMAYQKAHSTLGQAVDIGRQMRAENTLLTHFSARYPKRPPPELNPAAPVSPGGTPAPVLALAFDHTCVRIGEMGKLRAYLPAIERSLKDVAAQDVDDNEDGEGELDPAKLSW